MYSFNANNCLDSEVWLEKRSENEYCCHTPQFNNNNLREKKCIYCDQRKPSTLEEIAFSVILVNEELFKRFDSSLCHLPHRICWLIGRALNANLISQAWKFVGFVSEHGETRPSWFDVEKSKTGSLTRFRLYCEVNQKLKPFIASRSAGIDEILSYLNNVDSTYKDFWSKMTSAITKLKAETESEDLAHLKNMVCADENNVVLVKATELRKSWSWRDSYEIESMKELQRLNKTFACPVVFKPTMIGVVDLKSQDIPHLLDDIDPEVITDVEIEKTAWSVADVDELGRVLSECNKLSSIELGQMPTLNEIAEDVTSAVSRLLSHHHQLQTLRLSGFNLQGTLAKLPFPPVEDLQFILCTFTEEDWNVLANRSDLALKSLFVCCCLYGGHSPSLPIFLQNQARSLKSLGLEYAAMSIAEICKVLRIMAKFNKLERFCLMTMGAMDFDAIEKIIVDLMSIHSTRTFFIYNLSESDESETEAEIEHLKEVVKDLCKVNRRPPIELEIDCTRLGVPQP